MPPLHLVRLSTSGTTIHRSTCRHAAGPNAVRWVWADENPWTNWLVEAPWLLPCGVCLPPARLGYDDAYSGAAA